jgi:hypothetical protein
MQVIVGSFQQAMGSARAASQRAHQVDSAGAYIVPLAERELITQAAFLRMFVAFEEFLEHSFAHYAMAGTSLAGSTPVAYVNAPDAAHAHKMFIGVLTYMDWSSPHKVCKLAKLYFEDGEPFSGAIASATADLYDMKTVRNAGAHVSVTTSAQVEALYRRWTSQQKSSVTAYETLTATGVKAKTTFMTYADQILNGLVLAIADF